MITALFYIIYIGLVYFGYSLVQNLYLIPLWLIIGYPLAIVLVLCLVYVNYIWMAYTKPTNKLKNYIARSIIYLINHYVFGIKLEVVGKENIPKEGSFSIFANHKSLLDPLPVIELMGRPTTFTPKKSVMKYPLLGKYLKYLGAMPIDRESDRNTAKNLVSAIKNAKDGMCYLIFPEGGIRSRETEMMVEMRPGAYKLAQKAKTDLLVLSMKNMTQIPKNWPWKKTVIKINVHPLIKYETIEDIQTNELAQMVFDMVNGDFDNNES